ncbi:hypothetical protein I552_0702 [Mycobacterium xenopi 3993]|nr:hypothetical protein I552_0702 [Mycobacterium xenopi 3993]
MRQVDETLAEAQRLLGSSEPPAVTPRPTSSPQPVPPPQWQSGSATAATAVSAEISAQHGTFAALGDQTRTLVAEANTESMDAQRRLGGIRNEWETDKTALSAMPRTPDRDGAIIAAGQRRVLEAANVVQTAAERFDQAAGKVRRATAELPHPLAHVDPKPPPNPADADVRPYACYLGSKDNDPVKICGPHRLCTPGMSTTGGSCRSRATKSLPKPRWKSLLARAKSWRPSPTRREKWGRSGCGCPDRRRRRTSKSGPKGPARRQLLVAKPRRVDRGGSALARRQGHLPGKHSARARLGP